MKENPIMAYDLIRSSRRTLSIEITKDGGLLVRAPRTMKRSEIEGFLLEKKDWIRDHQKRWEERKQAYEEKTGDSAEERFTMEELRRMADEAVKVIPERVKHYAALLGVTYGRITIRNQKTRWGSCSAKGNLNFNCLLMLAPPEVLDSVIVHELCHRLHPNHSRSFYAAVYRIFPDYARCDRWLKQNGPALLRRAGY